MKQEHIDLTSRQTSPSTTQSTTTSTPHGLTKSATPSATPFSIMLEPGPFQKLKVSIGRNKVPLSPFSSLIPHEFRHLARQALSNFSQESDIIQFLNQRESSLTIHVLINKSWVECTYSPSEAYDKKCYVELKSSTVVLSKVAMKQNTLLTDIVTLGDQIGIDLDTHQMIELNPSDGWGLIDTILDEPSIGFGILENSVTALASQKQLNFSSGTGKKVIEVSHFLSQLTPINLDNPLCQTLLFKDKHNHIRSLAELPTIDVISQLNITQSVGETTITPMVHDGHNAFKLPVKLMEAATFQFQQKPILNKDHGIHYFAPILKDRIGDSVKVPAVPKTLQIDVPIEQLKSELDPLFATPWIRLHAHQEWSISNVNIQHELKSVLLVYDTCPKVDIDYDYLQFRCLTSYFSHHVGLLDQKAAELNIQLKHHTARFEKLDLDIDIETEFHPDGSITAIPTIRFQGKTILPEFIAQLIQEDGFLKTESSIQYLDSDTQLLLKSLFDFNNPKKETAKKLVSIQTDRLKIIDWFSLKNSGATLRLPPKEEALYNSLFNIKKMERFSITSQLKGTLRDYQREGVNWLLFLYKYRLGACLADDMGLGKTVQSIAFLATLHENEQVLNESSAPSLIVVPPSLVYNWIAEISQFYPSLNTYQYLGAQRAGIPEDTHIIVTTYDTLKRDIDTLKDRHFNVIIFDEAQLIKNIASDRSAAVRQLKGRFKCCLTGTPFENHLGEFYSILDLAVPGIFGSLSTFKKDIQNEEEERYIKRARPFVLRRTKDAILSELPEKTEKNIIIPFSQSQLDYYNMIREQVKATIKKAYETNQKSQAKFIALTALLRLRQVCVTPQLIDPQFDDPSPKIKYLIETLDELVEEGHSALVFSQFRSFLDIFESEVKKTNMVYNRIDGTTPQAKRKKEIEDFQFSQEPRVFLISLKTGGVGLNLTKASYVFHVDPWWNPQVENQASDRVHRIGQTQKVFINKLIMQNSIEEKIVELKESKKELFDSILNKELKSAAKIQLDAQDFLNLVS